MTLTTCNNSHDPYINYKAEPAQPLEKLSSELRRCAKNTQSPSARSNQVTTYVGPESQTHLLHHSIVVVGSYWGVSLWNSVYKVSRTGNRNIEVWTQCSRTDLNKTSLPRPKTTTAWKLIPHRSNIYKNWNPQHWVPLHSFQKSSFTNRKKSFTVSTFKLILLNKKFPMCRISILADIRPMGYKLSCCGSIWSR